MKKISRPLVSWTGGRMALSVLACVIFAAMSPAAVPREARADSVDDARREVEKVKERVAEVRRQYDALVSEVDVAQADLDVRQAQIVDLTLEMNRKQDALDERVIELDERIRRAYKDGPLSDVGVFLASDSLGEYWAARRYLSLRLERDRELIAEMRAEQEGLAALSLRLESDRAVVRERLDEVANLLDQTQALLADSEMALAASEADLQVKEEMRKAMELLNRGPSGTRPISQRHRRATEDQAELLRKYPFGPVSGIPPGFVATGEVVEGIASWYGPGFNGLPTASGAIYDENLYTCASKELPFGTMLVVTYRDRSVLVLVNDRGPYVKGRVLDLSRASRDAIGMGGLAYVRAEVVEPA